MSQNSGLLLFYWEKQFQDTFYFQYNIPGNTDMQILPGLINDGRWGSCFFFLCNTAMQQATQRREKVSFVAPEF